MEAKIKRAYIASSLDFLSQMRYYYEKPGCYAITSGKTYSCDHPIYDKCTLYLDGMKGLAVIQQRFVPENKSTHWSSIDPWLVDAIYRQPTFKEYFESHGGLSRDGLYPTVTIRQIMWALRMKPLRPEYWETAFEKNHI